MATSNFEIRQAEHLLEQAQAIAQLNQNVLRVQEELTASCAEIRNAWQSDTVDKESYLQGIEKNMQKIGNLTSALFKLSNHLTAFAQKSIQTANNGQ